MASSQETFVLSGCLTYEDALATQRLTIRFYRTRLILGVSVVSVFSILLTALAICVWPSTRSAAYTMLFVAWCPPVLAMSYCLINRSRLRELARKRYGMFAQTHSVFMPDSIIITSEGARSELQWTLFAKFKANDQVALLSYRNSRAWLILARSKLQAPGDWDAFVAFIRSKMPESQSFRGNSAPKVH